MNIGTTSEGTLVLEIYNKKIDFSDIKFKAKEWNFIGVGVENDFVSV